MKTFLRKLKLSFFAMLCGWIACNIAWWVPEFRYDERVHPVAFYEIAVVGVGSFIVIMGAWLLIFVPVDMLVPATSKLRRPPTAALCGLLTPLAILALIFVCNAHERIAEQGLLKAIRMVLGMNGLRFMLGACATGAVAAWARAWMDKPKRNQTP
jgi:hypothetical protein